jgi:hypothetical protein
MTKSRPPCPAQGSWWLCLIRLASRFAAGPEDACEQHNWAADQDELDRACLTSHDLQRSRRPADTQQHGARTTANARSTSPSSKVAGSTCTWAPAATSRGGSRPAFGFVEVCGSSTTTTTQDQDQDDQPVEEDEQTRRADQERQLAGGSPSQVDLLAATAPTLGPASQGAGVVRRRPWWCRAARPAPWGRTRAAAADRRRCGWQPCRGRRRGTRHRSGPDRCFR